MKYIICVLALLLTACLPHEMSVKEIEARNQYCYKNGAKGVNVFRHNKSNGILKICCVFDGYETASEYVEEKK